MKFPLGATALPEQTLKGNLSSNSPSSACIRESPFQQSNDPPQDVLQTEAPPSTSSQCKPFPSVVASPPPCPLSSSLPAPLLFPIHPPRLARSAREVLSYLSYELTPHLIYSDGGNYVRQKPSATPLKLPLKPITKSVISYDKLLMLAKDISSSVFDRCLFFVHILTDIDVFRSLFRSQPVPQRPGKKSALSRKDLADLKAWGTVSAAPRSFRAPCSNFAFKVPKSDQAWSRLILDCSEPNRTMVDPPSFQLASPILIVSKILSSNYGFTSDFTSWFFQHLLDPQIAAFFAFRVGPAWNWLNRLAQGWKFSPSIAQSSSEILAVDYFDPKFDKTLVWIDNVFQGADSLPQAETRRDLFLQRCQFVGAVLGEFSPVSTSIEYVGGEFDLFNKKWRVKSSWARKALALIENVQTLSSPRKIWAVMGTILWFLRLSLLPLAMADPLILFISRLSKQLTSGAIDWSQPQKIWPSALKCIVSFCPLLRNNAWRSLTVMPPFTFPPSNVVFSDASLVAGAVVWQGQLVWSQNWNERCSHTDILMLEAQAWEQAVCYVLSIGVRIFVSVVDNEALYYSLINSRCRIFRVSALIRRVFERVAASGGCLFAGWVPSELMPADAPSRCISSTSFPLPPVESIRISKYPVVCANYFEDVIRERDM